MDRRTAGALLAGVALAVSASACQEDFSDEAFGVLDLASVYDGGTRTNPTVGLPTQIDPQRGFIDGEQAEYYDFGAVPVQRDVKTGAPTGATVRPIYFFFDRQGRPLFSPPVRERRDGTDWMLGGRNVLDPNPVDHCAPFEAQKMPCPAETVEVNKQEKKKPYPVRKRVALVDSNRRVSDFQRPIVDVTPADRSAVGIAYTGLWEVVEVTAPDGYHPDAIKSWKTLERAVDSGDFKTRATGRVIDCPMVDERTYVPRGVTDRPTPHPRIELWYRRKLAFCFLAHGWETLGNNVKDPPFEAQLYFAGQDDERLDTFDVARIKLGEGKDETVRLVVPIGRAYVPAIFTEDQGGSPASITRVVENIITGGRPRHFRSDPPGYTPLRWMWDIAVDHDYESGALKSLEAVDRAITTPRRPVTVRNIALRGVAVRCSLPETTKPGPTRGSFKCGRVIQDPLVGDKIDASGDPRCNAIGLECNPDSCFCDVPFVGYGGACGPGVARCAREGDTLSPDGYTCFPPWGGFCYLRCRGINERQAENEGKKPTEFVDTRCKEIPGAFCYYPYERDERGGLAGLCIRFCDQNKTDPKQCAAPVKVGTETQDIGEGQTCQDWGLEICAWPDGYTPG